MSNIFQKEKLDVKENVSLAPYTTFKIGGSAKYFFIAQTADELIKALQVAVKNKIPFYVLGNGSNILISDKGFRGLVVKIKNDAVRHPEDSGGHRRTKGSHDVIIEADSGVFLSQLVSLASQEGLTGLEWAIGIPGTIGGAVRGNAGAYGQATSEAVKQIKVLKILNSKFSILNFDNKECKFGYRDSIFKQNPNLIILEVELKLKKGDSEDIKQEMKNIITKRVNKIPPFPNAGSFFKNYELIKKHAQRDDRPKLRESFPQAMDEQIESWIKRGKVPAAWLIEECGLKGKQIGGAKISNEHANFIINTGAAKAQDVIMLASLIKQQVRDKFGVQLEEEVELVGFNLSNH